MIHTIEQEEENEENKDDVPPFAHFSRYRHQVFDMSASSLEPFDRRLWYKTPSPKAQLNRFIKRVNECSGSLIV